MDALNDRLEIGGNVFEIIEFCLKRTDEEGNVIEGKYGVNVAKVREVIKTESRLRIKRFRQQKVSSAS